MTASNSMTGQQYQMAMSGAYQEGGMSVLTRILNQMNTKEKQSMLQNLMIEQGFQNTLANMKGGRVAGPKQPDPMAWTKGGSGGGMGGMMGKMGGMMGGMGGSSGGGMGGGMGGMTAGGAGGK